MLKLPAGYKMLRRCLSLLSYKEFLRHTFAAKIHTASGRILHCSHNKNLPNPDLQTSLSNVHSHDSNFLKNQISNAKTLNSVLELFSNHQDMINAHHIVELLMRLHDHSKEQGLDPETLRENQIFQDVCFHLMKELKTLEAQEVITVYKVLSSFGIPNNSYVMQSVLRVIGKQLNVLDLEQMVFLWHIISKQKHNALVDDLRMALPLVLQVKIDRLLDSGDMSLGVDCLHLAYRSRLRPETVQKIVSSILTKAKTLSPSNAVTVITALVHINAPVDGYKQLLDESFDIVTKDIESLNQDQVLCILKICREKGFRRNTFFSEAAKKAVSEKWCLMSTREVLKVLNAMKFFSPELKDHCARISCLNTLATAKVV